MRAESEKLSYKVFSWKGRSRELSSSSNHFSSTVSTLTSEKRAMSEKLSQSISPLVNYLIINVIAEISEIAYKDPVLQVRV